MNSGYWIGRFFRGSLVFSLGLLVYSLVRQLVFFPLLHKYRPDLFVTGSYLLLTCDMLVFPIAGTLGDFYQRTYANRDGSGYKNKVLQRFCFFALLAMPILVALRFDFISSFIATIFLYFYSKNNLIQRRIYNKFSFSESIRYNSFRTIPFCFIAGGLYWAPHLVNLVAIILLICCFEAIYCLFFLRQYVSVRPVKFSALKSAASVFFAGTGIVLFFSTLGGAYLQRGEVTMAGAFWIGEYSMAAMVCTLANVFIIPISMMTSTPLMSLLVHLKISLSRVRRIQISSIIFFFAVIVGAISYFSFPFILSVFYGVELKSSWRFALAFSLFSLTIFFATRTLIAKFSSPRNIILVNLVVAVLTVPLLLFSSVISFLVFWSVFSFARASAPLLLFLFERDAIAPVKI